MNYTHIFSALIYIIISKTNIIIITNCHTVRELNKIVEIQQWCLAYSKLSINDKSHNDDVTTCRHLYP